MKKQKKIILIALAVLIAVGTVTAVSINKEELPVYDSSLSTDTSEHDEECEDECCDDEIIEPTTEPTTTPTVEPSDEPVEDEETQTITPSPTTTPTETTTPSATSTTTPTQSPTSLVTEFSYNPNTDGTFSYFDITDEQRALMTASEIEFYAWLHDGCSICGSQSCGTFNYSNFTVDTTRCEYYDSSTDSSLWCQICGKAAGNGTNGTCVLPWSDGTCYYCGEEIYAGTCHTCE